MALPGGNGDAALADGERVARSSVVRPRPEESFEDSDSRAERATDLKLLVSELRAAEVGPGVLVGENGLLVLSRDDSPECLPFVRGSDELDAAEAGERISGVVDSMPPSKFGSSGFCAGFN